ncbi:MAG: hypothetical protein D6805_02570 [Planctomycetota bacterium]|nr:MAG: hypothetical protein D6805_02570 [Planctomycetota bacterium]
MKMQKKGAKYVLISTALVALLVGICGFLLPWWGFMVVLFGLGTFLFSNASGAFWVSFGGGAIMWGGVSLYYYLGESGQLLAERLRVMMGLPHGVFLVLLPAFLGGTLAGIASLTGHYGAKVCQRKKSSEACEK